MVAAPARSHRRSVASVHDAGQANARGGCLRQPPIVGGPRCRSGGACAEPPDPAALGRGRAQRCHGRVGYVRAARSLGGRGGAGAPCVACLMARPRCAAADRPRRRPTAAAILRPAARARRHAHEARGVDSGGRRVDRRPRVGVPRRWCRWRRASGARNNSHDGVFARAPRCRAPPLDPAAKLGFQREQLRWATRGTLSLEHALACEPAGGKKTFGMSLASSMSGRPLAAEDLDRVLSATAQLWKPMAGSRIFLSGGTGFFGAWLVESFAYANARLALGAELVVLSRDPAAAVRRLPLFATLPGVTLHAGDVRTFEYPAGRFDVVVHGAAESSAQPHAGDEQHMFDTIVDGTRRMLTLAESC